MATTSLNPIAADRFGAAQARHLLSRAGFGGTPAQIAALARMGLAQAVDHLVDYKDIPAGDIPQPKLDSRIYANMGMGMRRPGGNLQNMSDAQRDEFRRKAQANLNTRQSMDRQQLGDIQISWLARMIATPRPLEEKLTLLWHNHFASNYRNVRDSYLMNQQNEFFRAHAAGSFADLAQGVIKDPAMIVFLNNDRNVKLKPNENLARELMELFTLGIGHYTENDIKQGARALTGNTRRGNEFTFAQFAHDEGEKTILGKTGRFTGEDFVKILLDQPACAQFIAYKLYRHFVADLNDGVSPEARAVIESLASDIRSADYQLKPALKKLFASEHFYDPRIVGSQIKTPVQVVVGTIRSLSTPTRDLEVLLDALRVMGQEIYEPPNVAGWPGGRAWINTTTFFSRQNTAVYLLTGKLPYDNNWRKSDISYDATQLLAPAGERNAESVVDQLLSVTLPPPLSPERRNELLKFIADHDNRITSDTLVGLLCLITAMPEYQLC